jgi:hypothetical protein
LRRWINGLPIPEIRGIEILREIKKMDNASLDNNQGKIITDINKKLNLAIYNIYESMFYGVGVHRPPNSNYSCR